MTRRGGGGGGGSMSLFARYKTSVSPAATVALGPPLEITHVCQMSFGMCGKDRRVGIV